MLTDDHRVRLASAMEALRTAEQARKAAELALHEAMGEAVADGASPGEVGEVVQLSPPAVASRIAGAKRTTRRTRWR